MSSLNPVVGVSLCIGALGAGLAYLAWNNNDDNDVDHENVSQKKESTETAQDGGTVQENNKENREQKVEENSKENVEEKQDEDVAEEETTEKENIEKEVKQDVKLEVKEMKKKKTNMQQFLQQTYNETQ